MDIFLEKLLKDSSKATVGKSAKLIRVIKFTKFVKVLKLMRAFKLKNLFYNIQDFFQIENWLNVFISFFRLSIFITGIAHWCACIWHYVAVVDNQQIHFNWIQRNDMIDESWISK